MTFSWLIRRRVRGDRGAFLLLFALTLVAIITFVAFAVDLGQARASQRANRSTADLAALSAGYWLAGGKFTGVQPVADAEKACIAAVQSVQTNEPSFKPTQDPATECAAQLPDCNPAAPPGPGYATFSDARMTLTIQYPVAYHELQDDRFSGAGVNDGSDPCERMRITLDRTDDVAFAGVIGVTSLHTSGSVVVKGDIQDPNEDAVPAFLMLERTDCSSITTSVGSGPGIEVHATVNLKNEPQPGYMHSDSNSTTNCKKIGDRDGYAIYGGNDADPESIILHPADGEEGIVEAVASEPRGAGGYIRGSYRTGGLVSRQPADDMYGASLTGIHESADKTLDRIASLTSDAVAAPAGYDVFDCDGLKTLDDPSDDLEAYVFCPSPETFDVTMDGTLDGYEEVLFSNDITLSSGNVISLPDAKEIGVGGTVDVAGVGTVFDAPAAENVSIGNRLTVPKNGVLSVNRGLSSDPATPQCPQRQDPDGENLDPSDDNTTIGPTARVVVFGSSTDPAVDIAGNLTLCEATLYLAGERSDGYERQIDESGGECTEKLPCPLPSADPGARYHFAAGATVNLIGPNSTASKPPESGWSWSSGQDGGIEDLAFWTEGGGLSEVKGTATLTISGVFSAPNGILEFRSGPASTEPVDAQYIARKLRMLEGLLKMRPTAMNTVSVPVPGSFSLIR